MRAWWTARYVMSFTNPDGTVSRFSGKDLVQPENSLEN